MSLLMDALRKAEEAKKKAAQEAQSEEAAPVAAAESRQTSVDAENVSVDPPAPEIELSMVEKEEVSSRSVVPNLETPIEFEDEEDYVLPTSVDAAEEPAVDSVSRAEQSPPSKNVASDELEPVNPRAGGNPDPSVDALENDSADSLISPDRQPEPEQQKVEKVVHEGFDFDGFESFDDNPASIEDVTPDSKTAVLPDTKQSARVQSPRVAGNVAEHAREKASDRDAPGRKTARSVFAAKKSPLLQNSNVKVAAGGALAFLVVAFASYFYISLSEESTFNIPAGSYATREFVNDGVPLDAVGNQLSIEAITVTEAEAAAITAADSAPEQVVISGSVNADDTSAAPTIADTLIASPVPGVVATPEATQSAANLQPETIAQQTSLSETISTTIGAAPTVAVEPEVVVQPVASISAQAATSVEPTNLISFRKQATVVTVDPNVDRAYAAYQQGSLDQAEALYRQTLTSDPRQRDALLGLANITARNGNTTEALDLYSRLLARNPNDPIARAGLMELLPAGSPSVQEAELKRLLDDYPGIAALSYAYGNFLSSNQRWSEAQQAYFRALQLAKSDAALNGLVNPDYAFNLAVSLEHLNQSVPAQNYYQEALNYAANHPAGFDLAAVRSRLANMVGNGKDD